MNPDRLVRILQVMGWSTGILFFLATTINLFNGIRFPQSFAGFLIAFLFWSYFIGFSYIIRLIIDLYKNQYTQKLNPKWIVPILRNGGWFVLSLVPIDVYNAMLKGLSPSRFIDILTTLGSWLLMLAISKAIEGLYEIRERNQRQNEESIEHKS